MFWIADETVRFSMDQRLEASRKRSAWDPEVEKLPRWPEVTRLMAHLFRSRGADGARTVTPIRTRVGFVTAVAAGTAHGRRLAR